MVLGEVIGEIVFAFGPIDKKMALADAITDPIKTHVDGLGATLFDGVIGNAGSTSIVSVNTCGILRVSKFGQSDAKGSAILQVVEKRAKFSFSSG